MGRPNYPHAAKDEPSGPAHDVEAVTLGANWTPTLQETPETQFARALYVGTGGDVKVDTLTQTAKTFKNVPAGTFIPCFIKKVYSTANGTTAADILALY